MSQHYSLNHDAIIAIVQDSKTIQSAIFANEGEADWTVMDIHDLLEDTLGLTLNIEDTNLFGRLLTEFNRKDITGIELNTMVPNDELELAIIKEANSGLVFAVEASYLSQEVDALHSPYGNGIITLEQ